MNSQRGFVHQVALLIVVVSLVVGVFVILTSTDERKEQFEQSTDITRREVTSVEREENKKEQIDQQGENNSQPISIQDRKKERPNLLEALQFPKGTEVNDQPTYVSFETLSGTESVSELSDADVTINNQRYYIRYIQVHTAGACSMEDYGESCGSTDVQLKSPEDGVLTPIIRVWEDKTGAFLLNPQSIPLKNGGVIKIYKGPIIPQPIPADRNEYGHVFSGAFTQAEIDMWVDIFKSSIM